MANEQKELVPRRIKRELPVKLTESELAATAKEIGKLNRERQAMEAQAKQAASQWKDRISGLDARISDLAEKADGGVEARVVDCEEMFDYRRGEVRVVRLDTNEQLETRPMTSDERQPSLPAPGMDTKKEKEKAPKKPSRADAAHANAEAPAEGGDAPPESKAATIENPQEVLDAEKAENVSRKSAKKDDGEE